MKRTTKLDLHDYQKRAAETDRLPPDDRVLPLIGLGGEVGQLMAEYKKRERDLDGYRAFRDEVEEELGDILWYAATLASRNDLNLAEIAEKNLVKAADLFDLSHKLQPIVPYDRRCKAKERFPRQLTVTFVETEEPDKSGTPLTRVRMYRGEQSQQNPIGDPLDDNSGREDDYRYHDVFHLAHMAVLGWSPVLRGLMKCKRGSKPVLDRIEDGGRAAALEEGVTAYVFSEAEAHNWFETAAYVPPAIIKMTRKMTQHLEVASRTRNDWQHAILRGYSVFRDVRAHHGGVVTADLDKRTLTFDAPTPK